MGSTLSLACDKKTPELVDKLLATGADVNSKNQFGLTCIEIASQASDLELVTKLLAKGATPTTKALQYAWEKKSLPIVVALSNAGATI